MPSPLRALALPVQYRARVPAAFHVCHKSRSEVREVSHPFNGEKFGAAIGTLINLEWDTVYCPELLFDVADPILPKSMVGDDYYFPDRPLLFRLSMDVEFADRVKYLAVLTVGFKAQGTMRENMIKDVRKFENLIELTFAGSEGSGENDLAPRQKVDGEPRLVPGRPCPNAHIGSDCLLDLLQWMSNHGRLSQQNL